MNVHSCRKGEVYVEWELGKSIAATYISFSSGYFSLQDIEASKTALTVSNLSNLNLPVQTSDIIYLSSPNMLIYACMLKVSLFEVSLVKVEI